MSVFDGSRFPPKKVSLRSFENDVVPQINQVVAKHPLVDIGSYPFLEGAARTVVTFEGREEDVEAVLAAVADFTRLMGEEVMGVSDSNQLPASIAGQRSRL